MKKLLLLLVVMAAGAGGYYVWNMAPPTPQDGTLSGYTQRVVTSEQKAKVVVSESNLKDVQDAIEKYKTDKGILPGSLQDLVPTFLDHVPSGVGYDPASGAVSVSQ
jgi:hypothetical protein